MTLIVACNIAKRGYRNLQRSLQLSIAFSGPTSQNPGSTAMLISTIAATGTIEIWGFKFLCRTTVVAFMFGAASAPVGYSVHTSSTGASHLTLLQQFAVEKACDAVPVEMCARAYRSVQYRFQDCVGVDGKQLPY